MSSPERFSTITALLSMPRRDIAALALLSVATSVALDRFVNRTDYAIEHAARAACGANNDARARADARRSVVLDPRFRNLDARRVFDAVDRGCPPIDEPSDFQSPNS